METLGNLSFGLGVALNWQNIVYWFIGCFLGTLVGVLPGIGPVATVATVATVAMLLATFAELRRRSQLTTPARRLPLFPC
jgi:TctA family transporter